MPTRTSNDGAADGDYKPCSIKLLDSEKWVPAAAEAIKRNPANAPNHQMLQRADPKISLTKDRLALLTTKFWGSTGVNLTVSFLDKPPSDLRARILSHMNAWSEYANVRFVEVASDGQVRISRTTGDGYYSYLGTDILHVPKDQPTMNLDSFSMNTPESEYHRVVRHETGHTLAFPHEHMRTEIVSQIDPKKAYQYFWATQGWDKAEVDAQVLTPLDLTTLVETGLADQTSIMCYGFPGSIMKTGVDVPGGTDIDTSDGAFAALMYPKKVRNLTGT